MGKPRPLSAVPRVTAGRGVTGAAGARSAPAALPSIEAQDEDEEQTRVASSSLLAGAFSQAVAAAPKPAPLEPASGLGDEWHVGINGVPVGPMRLNELRSKAASGAINKDSLVWQDGFEEWKPLSTFPELVAIVEESLSSTRAAPAPLVPAAAEPPKFAPAPLVISDPFAASAAPPPAAPSAGAVTGSALVTESPGDLGLALKRPSSSKAAWIAVVVALLCGLTIGFVVFSNQKPVVKIVEVPARTTAAPAAIPAPEPPPSATPIEEVTNVAAPRKGGGRAPAPAAPPPETKPPSRLTGLSGLQAGPQHGPVAGQAQERAATSQGLDGAMVERTVSRYTGSVKRRCWQPALDTRGKDAPSSARVSASITVGPSGAVQSVTSSGDPQGYHGLASCITSSIRSWQFPASSGTTTVNVPFVFASQ